MHTQTLTTLTFRHVPHATVEALRRQKQDPLEAPDSALSTQAASPVGSLTSICSSATSFATSANRCAHLHECAYMLNCMFVCVNVLTCMLNSIYLPPPTAALRGHIPPRPSKHQRHPSRALSWFTQPVTPRGYSGLPLTDPCPGRPSLASCSELAQCVPDKSPCRGGQGGERAGSSPPHSFLPRGSLSPLPEALASAHLLHASHTHTRPQITAPNF